MSREQKRYAGRLSPRAAAQSEDNLSISVQVNLGVTSSRGRGTTARSRSSSREPSPSVVPGPLSRVETANNSQMSTVSQDKASAEDLLIGLTTPTDTHTKAHTLADALKDLKRRHDDDTEDERRPKRDRLSDELEQMHATLLDTSRTSTASPVSSGVEGAGAPDVLVSSNRAPDGESRTIIPLRPRQDTEATAAAAAANHRKAESSFASDQQPRGKEAGCSRT